MWRRKRIRSPQSRRWDKEAKRSGEGAGDDSQLRSATPALGRIQQFDQRIGPATAAPAASREQGGGFPSPFRTILTPRSPPPTTPDKSVMVGCGHLRRGSWQRPGWKQGPGRGESDWGSAKSTGWRVRSGHPGDLGPRQETLPSKTPGALQRLWRAASPVPAPAAPTVPHLTLPEPLPPPQPKAPQPQQSEPFSTQSLQPLPRASADSAASQA